MGIYIFSPLDILLVMRHLLFYIFIFTGTLFSFAGEELDQFLKESGLNENEVSVVVLDLSDGKLIENYNSQAPLIPASIMKTVTIGTLLKNIGPDYQYNTNVFLTSTPSDGLCNGNLVIVGSGDPSLNSTAEPRSTDFIEEIVNALKKKNIRDIRGRIVIDDNIFSGPSCPPSWHNGDLAHAYGTGSHGFNFENNASGSRSVANPNETFSNRLKNALTAAGIVLGNESVQEDERSLLMSHVSPPIDEIMRSCMMRSDNLFAESLLRLYSVETGGDGSTADGASKVRKYWKGRNAPMENVTIIDGSGLSRSNRVTGKFMTYLLQNLSIDPVYASFFPLAGQEGTLKKFLAGTPLDSYVALKTGSMSGIQCYAGYKLDEDYVPTHVIVVIMNEMNVARSQAREALQHYLLSVFNNPT